MRNVPAGTAQPTCAPRPVRLYCHETCIHGADGIINGILKWIVEVSDWMLVTGVVKTWRLIETVNEPKGVKLSVTEWVGNFTAQADNKIEVLHGIKTTIRENWHGSRQIVIKL